MPHTSTRLHYLDPISARITKETVPVEFYSLERVTRCSLTKWKKVIYQTIIVSNAKTADYKNRRGAIRWLPFLNIYH